MTYCIVIMHDLLVIIHDVLVIIHDLLVIDIKVWYPQHVLLDIY